VIAGTLNEINYWKVKNSWGPAWGQNGYVLIEQTEINKNTCGLLSNGVYPNLVPLKSVAPTPAPTASATVIPIAGYVGVGSVNSFNQGVQVANVFITKAKLGGSVIGGTGVAATACLALR
jgi:hypothetical protein